MGREGAQMMESSGLDWVGIWRHLSGGDVTIGIVTLLGGVGLMIKKFLNAVGYEVVKKGGEQSTTSPKGVCNVPDCHDKVVVTATVVEGLKEQTSKLFNLAADNAEGVNLLLGYFNITRPRKG